MYNEIIEDRDDSIYTNTDISNPRFHARFIKINKKPQYAEGHELITIRIADQCANHSAIETYSMAKKLTA